MEADKKRFDTIEEEMELADEARDNGPVAVA